VQEQVDRIWGNLPNDPTLQRPVITKFDSNSLPVVRLFVTDPNMSLRDLGDLYTNTLGDEFSAIDGVAAVTVSNDQQRAIMVEPNAFALAANGITLRRSRSESRRRTSTCRPASYKSAPTSIRFARALCSRRPPRWPKSS